MGMTVYSDRLIFDNHLNWAIVATGLYVKSSTETNSSSIKNNYSAKGSLTINKNVDGLEASKTKEFNFTLTLDDTNINGVYNGVTFESGVAKFSLKHGSSITITNLPHGLIFTVTEDDYTSDGYTTKKTNSTGTIVGNTNIVSTFTNTKVAGIVLAPIKLTFSATKTVDEGVPNTNSYNFVLKNSSGRILQNKTNAGSLIVFDALNFDEEGVYTYTINEVVGNDQTIDYDTRVYLITIRISLSSDKTKFLTNITYKKDGVNYSGELIFANVSKDISDEGITIMVNKVWKDNNVNRPTSVAVQLYKDGLAYKEKVTLEISNGWQYIWKDLDKTANWTIDEVNVRSDYYKEVSNQGNNWTITNTIRPKIPQDENPKTGDNIDVMSIISLMFASLFVVVMIFISNKKKHDRKDKI